MAGYDKILKKLKARDKRLNLTTAYCGFTLSTSVIDTETSQVFYKGCQLGFEMFIQAYEDLTKDLFKD